MGPDGNAIFQDLQAMRRLNSSCYDRIGLRLGLWVAVIGMVSVLTWCVWY